MKIFGLIQITFFVSRTTTKCHYSSSSILRRKR